MKHEMPTKSDMPKLYAAVASLPCQLCGKEGVQVSHSNQSRDGKGMSLKAYPWRVAALCPECHVSIDSGHQHLKQKRVELWETAHRKTVGELFARGLVRPI